MGMTLDRAGMQGWDIASTLAPLYASDAWESIAEHVDHDYHIMAQTTLDEWAKDPVDPEIRAHVYSLITAVRSSIFQLVWLTAV